MTLSSEEFRLERVDRMDALSLAIFRAVDDAQAETIGGDDFAEALEPYLEEAFYHLYAEDTFALRDNAAAAWRWTWQRIKPGLVKASDLASPQRIADWLGTALVNAAAMVTTDRSVKKMWLSRRDDKVRPFHVEVDGQTVPLSEPFTVCDGRKMDFPGQPVGDPDCWINCRCVVRTVNGSQSLLADADPGSVGVCIVAIPADGDDIWTVSSEQVPHMTLVWLGQNPDLDKQAVLAGIKDVAQTVRPVTTDVAQTSLLGDDDAEVAMVDPGLMGDVRTDLLANADIRAGYDAVEQFPQWTPHVTLGYPDAPPKGAVGSTIQFDRLALWDQEYEGEEFPMTAPVIEDVDLEPVDVPVPEEDDELVDLPPTPWHGVLAPEGVASGDGRKFTEGAITWRDLPLPLLWQESSGMGHDGAVIVGQIADIWREGNLINASGTFANNEAAEKVIGLMADGHLRGVSVDIDSAEMAMESEEEMLFSSGRISAATMCAIPAFAEAFVSLGAGDRSPAQASEPSEALDLSTTVEMFISEEPWDGSASRFTPEQWKSSCCLHLRDEVEPKSNHKLPIKEPGGALSRGGTHAAAGRFNQTEAPPEKKAAAKSTLRGAYKTLGEQPPDVLKASGWNDPTGSMAAWRADEGASIPTAPDPLMTSAGSGTGTATQRGTGVSVTYSPTASSMNYGSATSPMVTSSTTSAATSAASIRPISDQQPASRTSNGAGAGTESSTPSADAGSTMSPAPKRGTSGPADALAASASGTMTVARRRDEYGRGPGWVTDPVATRRVHDYWTKPGHEGYAKIAWGTPGDFRRLRAYLSKYIGPQFLNRTTAQWHHDALGYWPGELGKPGNPVTRTHAGQTVDASVILASVEPGIDIPLAASWFRDPQFTQATALTVTDDGRVFGHLAEWGVCHIGIPGTCVEAPHSAYSYAYFTTGAVETDEGPVPVGQITMDTGHAARSAGPNIAAAHYDNTGSVVADIAVGEDSFGIWVAGALRDNVPAEKRRALQAGALSGDWRLIRDSLELVAALAVNVPGFPIPRTGLAAAGGVQTSLVAAGVVVREAGDSDDVAEFITAVAQEVEARAARRARAAALLDDTRDVRVAALLATMEG